MKIKHWLIIMLLWGFSPNLMAKKVAFLIGVGNVPLKLNTALDIKTIRSLLAKDFDRVIELQDNEATYNKIKKVFEKELYGLNSNDTLFFYYTGHGGRFYHGKEQDRTDEFLVLSSMDARGDEVYGGVMIDDELNYHFSQIRAKKVLFFDCCHSKTMKKGLGGTAKFWHPKGGTIVYRKFDVDRSYAQAINSHYINLSATNRDEDQSEDSENGGVFTLTLKKVLKEQGDISFSELIVGLQNNLSSVAHQNGTSGDFIPYMESHKLNPKSFRTKDIFAVPSKPTPKPNSGSLEKYLQSKVGGLEMYIEGKQKGVASTISVGGEVMIVSHLTQQSGKLYVLVVKGESYSLVAQKKVEKCHNNRNRGKKECVFKSLVSLPPYGLTNVYLIYSQNPLDISKSHSKGFSESLKSQLQHQSFEVGYDVFKTVE
jgi:hypothetical protein